MPQGCWGGFAEWHVPCGMMGMQVTKERAAQQRARRKDSKLAWEKEKKKQCK